MPRKTVGVVGRGYVGGAVAGGLAPISDVVVHDIAEPGSATIERVAGCDVVFVCVPTPAMPCGGADVSAVRSVIGALEHLASGAVVVIKSTVPPGTTEQLAVAYPRLAICCSPEFLRERSAAADFAAPARVIVGVPRGSAPQRHAPACELLRERFAGVPQLVMEATSAEMLKYASNAFFAVKVSFANELCELAQRLGIDWEPIRAALALDPRVGADHLQVPGPDGAPGYGGRCLPKDVSALLQLAEAAGGQLPVVASAAAANRKRRG
ncbi:MAG: UDP-glucose/GDP-mannose dehydrogenase family protein [Myxococcales bacterium]|nr:UDP-glucose/GDP-mannose dehydrogenase family protein [Myxococcales bacterium]